MFTFQEYLTGWLIYCGLVVALLSIFWWLSRKIPWFYVKQCLRLIVAAILLVPTAVPDTSHFWAPAWIVGALELMFTGIEGFLPIGRSLLLGIIIALFVYCLLLFGTMLIQKRRAVSSKSTQ